MIATGTYRACFFFLYFFRDFLITNSSPAAPFIRLGLAYSYKEEYGFPAGASGPVALPCDEDSLRDVLRRVSGAVGRAQESATASSSKINMEKDLTIRIYKS